MAPDPATATPKATRSYQSPLRRARSAQTRERIIDAACTLLRHSSVRDWGAVTIRGVAEEAGVNERTVYRYFTNERGLRDAVMHRMSKEAGIELAGMELGDIAKMAARVFDYVAKFPLEPKPRLEPTLKEANQRQREALHDAVAPWTTEWDPVDAAGIAALFDLLWSVGAYERLTRDWQLKRSQATRTLTWAIEVVADAIRAGRQPEGFGR